MLHFWYEFASTYSHLAAQRIEKLAAEAGVEIRWRPFLLGPIFAAQGWTTSPFNLYPAKGRYMARDLERLSAEIGLPFSLPQPFPANSLNAARVALVGAQEGWIAPFTKAVFEAEFCEGANIAEPDTLRGILTDLEVDASRALEASRSDPIKQRLKAETEEAQRLGVFGAPSFMVEGELFWGNDRLEDALRWAVRPGR
jgi:2-hydroxychromene-2-carboxylate isomerase